MMYVVDIAMSSTPPVMSQCQWVYPIRWLAQLYRASKDRCQQDLMYCQLSSRLSISNAQIREVKNPIFSNFEMLQAIFSLGVPTPAIVKESAFDWLPQQPSSLLASRLSFRTTWCQRIRSSVSSPPHDLKVQQHPALKNDYTIVNLSTLKYVKTWIIWIISFNHV